MEEAHAKNAKASKNLHIEYDCDDDDGGSSYSEENTQKEDFPVPPSTAPLTSTATTVPTFNRASPKILAVLKEKAMPDARGNVAKIADFSIVGGIDFYYYYYYESSIKSYQFIYLFLLECAHYAHYGLAAYASLMYFYVNPCTGTCRLCQFRFCGPMTTKENCCPTCCTQKLDVEKPLKYETSFTYYLHICISPFVINIPNMLT